MKLDKPRYHVYNAVRGERIDLYTLAAMVNEVADVKQPIIVCREGYANEYTANNDRILNELPEIQFTDMKDAVRELYGWYRQHESEIDIFSLIYG